MDVVATFFIKTITHWPPLNVSKNNSYFVLKLVPKARTSWSNSHFPFTINNCFSPLLFLPLTPTMMTTIVVELRLWRELLNYLMESLWKNIETNLGSKAMIGDTMITNSIVMITCMSHFTNHLLDLDSMSKFSTFKIIFFANTTHAYLYEVIGPWKYCGLNCPIQQITMQICIAWILHAFICNLIKSAIHIEHLCFKHNIF